MGVCVPWWQATLKPMIKGVVIDITTAKLSKSLADAPAPSQQQADDQEDEIQVRPQASHSRTACTHQAVRHKAKGEFLALHTCVSSGC
jgi:hypothetical protein